MLVRSTFTRKMLEEICPTCGKGKLVAIKKEENIENRQFSCGHSSITIEKTLRIQSELRLKLKGPKGKRKRSKEIDSSIKEDFERRTIRTRGPTKDETTVIMIDWKRGNLSHIHCKTCGNEWRDNTGENVTERFKIEPTPSGILNVKCMKCGRESISG